MRVYGFCAVALVLASLPVAALAIVTNASPSPGAPVRHLVYSLTWGATTDLETHTSGFADETGAMKSPGAPSGIASSTAGTQDQGTITVDVEREQPDRGLVVDISEQANGRRSAPSATCVVFGNTHIICDPNKKINAEELTLLTLPRLELRGCDPARLQTALANRAEHAAFYGDVRLHDR